MKPRGPHPEEAIAIPTMHTIIHPNSRISRAKFAGRPDASSFRSPPYECTVQDDALKIVVFLPGVDAAGASVEARGPDLVVTGRKAQFVRVNWQPLHLESAQRDYRLSLRLGRGFDYASMQAEMHQGVLTVLVPKRAGHVAGATRLRQVA